MNKYKKLKIQLIIIIIGVVILSLLNFISTETPTGLFSVISVAPEDFSFQEPMNLSPEAAKTALGQAEKEIKWMKQDNMSTTFVEDAFKEANKSYLNQDYLNVFKVTQLITFTKNYEINSFDEIKLTKNKMEQFQEEGMEISKIKNLIKEAEEFFNKEQFKEADASLEKANSELEKAQKEHSQVGEIILLGKNFMVHYWWQLLIIVITLNLLSVYSFKKLQQKRLKNKIEKLRLESKETKELIKQLQKTSFVDNKKKIIASYKIKAAKHENRIIEIKHILPVLEAQLKGKKSAEHKKK